MNKLANERAPSPTIIVKLQLFKYLHNSIGVYIVFQQVDFFEHVEESFH